MKPRLRLSRRELLSLAALPPAAICGWGLRELLARNLAGGIDNSLDDTPPLPNTPEINRLKRSAEVIEPLFSKMGPPEPDEWLAKHVEYGQTFAQFLYGATRKLCEQYSRIGLVPIGKLSDTQGQLFFDAAEFIPRFFGFPVEVLEPASLDDLPDEAQRVRESGDRQVLTSYLRDHILLPRRSDDMAAVVGITARDVWNGDFSFLFGEASFSERACICSVARFGDVDDVDFDYAVSLRRTVGLIAHETGHTFGIPHCIAYRCRMTGSNHLRESDRRPLEFCPECLPKIWWTCGIDPHDRFVQLSKYADTHRLFADEKLWRSATARLEEAEGIQAKKDTGKAAVQ